MFYDLGSGTGKAVMLARLLFDFSNCVGIEYLEGLYKQSVHIQNRYHEKYLNYLAIGQSNHTQFIHDSILDVEWYKDGDVIFANSTCFSDELMNDMSQVSV